MNGWSVDELMTAATLLIIAVAMLSAMVRRLRYGAPPPAEPAVVNEPVPMPLDYVAFGIGWLWQRATRSLRHRTTPAAPATPATRDTPPSQSALFTPVAAHAARPTLHNLPAARRQHTVIAARPGDGKTTALNSLLVTDLAAGCQVIVCNPQFTYWHPTDQPIDLRPIRHQFELIRDEAAIAATIRAVYEIGKSREPLYWEGEDVGHVISLHIDEWPRLVDSDYGKICVEFVRKIVRELRKVNVFVTLATQDGQVETLGMSSGVRSSFLTKLVGNVDAATWRALIGGPPQHPVPRGVWATEHGDITVVIPTAQDIAALAHGITRYVPIVDTPAEPTPRALVSPLVAQVAERISASLRDHGTLPSRRSVEQHLFGYTGGDAHDQVSRVWDEAMRMTATTTTPIDAESHR